MSTQAPLARHFSSEPGGHRPDAPLEVFWTLSGLCNLSCSFCMTSSGPAPRRGGLGPAGRAAVLAQLIEARVLKVYVTGGEPLVLPDIWEILGGLLGAGVFVELTTNGTRLDAASCARLKGLGVSSVQVSLEAADEATNAPLMGTGARDKILAGIDAALAAGLPVHVRPTVMAGNIHALPALVEDLAARGVTQVDLREVTPLGRAAQGFAARRPDLEDLIALEDFCRAWSHPRTRIQFESWSAKFARTEHPALCTLGASRPATVLIDESGHLAGCSATFYLGFENPVLEHGLLGAWERLTVLKRYRDPEKLTGECAPCELRDSCRGGCRAAAARLTGDVHAPDPLCPRVDADLSAGADADLELWADAGRGAAAGGQEV